MGKTYPSFKEWVANKGLPTHLIELVDYCYHELEKERQDPLSSGHRLKGFSERSIACTHSDAILEVAKAILCQEDWVLACKGRYEWVAVDEAQDMNSGQWELVKWLAKRHSKPISGSKQRFHWQNLMIVGDDFQSLYSWRGARPDLLVKFISESGPGIRFYPLTTNFRSGQAIIDIANAALRSAKNRIFSGELNCGRPELDAHTSLDEFSDRSDEAEFVANSIQEEISRGTPPSEIAALYRINASSGPLEMELIRRKVPYRLAGRGFFARPEVDAAIRYIALALDPEDREAYSIAYRVPFRFIGRKMLAAYPTLKVLSEEKPGKVAGRWKGAARFVRDVKGVTKSLEQKGLVAALKHAFNAVGIRRHYIQEGEQDESGIEMIDSAIAGLLSCAKSAKSPEDFLEKALQGLEGKTADPDDKQENKVTLSTMHSGKGLEWTSVYLIGLQAGLLPLKDAPYEEEKRLLYVAITRAKTGLHMSYSANRPGEQPVPSPFLWLLGLKRLAQA